MLYFARGSVTDKLSDAELRVTVCEELKRIGYTYVTLDLQGYRQGSVNEVLATMKKVKQ